MDQTIDEEKILKDFNNVVNFYMGKVLKENKSFNIQELRKTIISKLIDKLSEQIIIKMESK